MQSRLVGALALLAVACGGDDSGGATPYSDARSKMCGGHPDGVWQVTLTGDPRTIPGQTEQLCQLASNFPWDFAMATHINQYDQGCSLQTTAVFGDAAEMDELDVMWSDTDKWTGTVRVIGTNHGVPCEAIADVTLTR